MSNITPGSSSAMNSSPLLSADLTFDDIISDNSIFSDSPPDDDTIVPTTSNDTSLTRNNEPTAQSTITKPAPSTPTTSAEQLPPPQPRVVGGLTKLVPKSPTTAATSTTKLLTTVKAGNPGQVVLIQGPSGPVPVRIASSSASTVNKSMGITTATATGSPSTSSLKDSPTNKNPPVKIQVLKMADGTLVPLKSNKALNLTNLTNISQLNVGGGNKILVKTSNGQKTIVATSSAMKPNAGTPVLKSISLAEAQKAGFIKPKDTTSVAKIQKMPPLSSASSSTATLSTNASGVREITIKSESDGTTKKIVVPQHMLKVPPKGGSNIQAIQVPGKPGVQYIRVVSSSASNSGPSKVIVKKEGPGSSPTKMTTTQKIVIDSNGRISTTNNPVGLKPNPNLSTVPTLRKIQDDTKHRPATTASGGGGTHQLLQIKRVNPTTIKVESNEAPVVLNQKIATGTYSKVASMHGQTLNRKRPSADDLNISDESGHRPKQFSVLKNPPASQTMKMSYPTEFTDEQLAAMFAKRSPTPEALRRKHCNCTKSQCLKLYCDCFANGEFCQDCNCKECFNNLEYEEERQKAIKICLERNPNAFKPKITKAKDQSDLRLHNKGCNCKRSGCLKNYCECYEAKIACSSNCKCFGCRNVEDRSERERLDESVQSAASTSLQSERPRAPKRTHDDLDKSSKSSASTSTSRLLDSMTSTSATAAAASQAAANKEPYNFITQDVVDATIQCMIAQANECKKNGMANEVTERMIIEEFGRCLVEIIDFSIRNVDN